MSRRVLILRTLQVLLDLVVLGASFALAFGLRFEGVPPEQMLKRLVVQGPYVLALQYGLLSILGVPQFSWRYVGLREALRIVQAITLAALILAAIRLAAAAYFRDDGYAQFAYLPFGVIAIDCALAVLGLAGLRVTRRISTERAEIRRLTPETKEQVRTLLVGAGRGGVMVAKEIAGRPELKILPVGFVDDDADKRGSVVHGIKVLGGMHDILRIARERSATQAIITVANAEGNLVRKISEACLDAGLKVKIIPGLFRLVGGELNLTRIRDVAIEDLLQRETVVLDDVSIAAEVKDGVVLVTGAGGSIGSEICRQLCRFQPKRLILVERSENALFEIHRDLLSTFQRSVWSPA